MKKLLYIFTFCAVTACNRDRDNSPVPAPSFEMAEKQQAPFGTAGVDVKLRKVLYNNRLVSEFEYSGDYLSQEKKYVTFATPALWATRSFTRDGGLPISSHLISAYVSGEGGFVSKDFNPSHHVTFNSIANDSVRTLTEDHLTSSETYIRDFTFDKAGYAIRETQTRKGQKSPEYAFFYLRDSKHNIAEVWQASRDTPNKVGTTRYEYDNHPNPFFKLGVDWQDQISVHVLSPNNIVREIRVNEDGTEIHTNYTYEYNAAGYPKKVTVQTELPDYDPHTLDFIY